MVRVFEDKSLLIITQEKIATRAYQDHQLDNNFAVSPIRTDILEGFYKTLSPSQQKK